MVVKSQKQESSLSSDNARTVITDIVLFVESCSGCSELLKGVKSEGHERRTRIDIIFKKTVEHFDAEIKHCPSCRSVSKEDFPSGIHGKLQYGNGLKAFIIHLIVSQMVAINRVQKMIKAMIGQRLLESTLLGFALRLHLALEKWEANAKEQILLAPSLYVDKTSMKLNG